MDVITNLITELNAILKGVSILTLVACIMICGYKIMFGGQTVQECKSWIIGGVLIVSSTYLASLFT